MEPEEAIASVHRAEREVLPIIKQMQLPPGAAFFLLAQYTQVFMTGDPRLSVESGTEITNTVLTLWREGLYTPSSEYPYTLEQTLQDAQDDQKATHDYAELFRSFDSMIRTRPHGHKVSGGLVKHPETLLWQIWMLLDASCTYIGAYTSLEKAQHNLAVVVDALRRRVTPSELERVYTQVGQGDGEPKQIPFAMMEYLLEHIDQYSIEF